MRPDRATLLLATLALTLTASAAWQLATDSAEHWPIAANAGAGAPAAAQPPSAGGPPEARDTSAITERPLFVRTRRLPAPIAAAIAAEAPPPPPAPPLATRYQLLGISRAAGDTTALLREVAGARMLRLRSGEQLGGWTLAGIEGRRVLRFERGDESQTLTLEAKATRRTAGQPGGSPAASRTGRPPADDDDDEDEPPRPSGRR